MNLTKQQQDGLETVEDVQRNFSSCFTGRSFLRKTAHELLGKGLLESVGLVSQCDGDGAIIETRMEREGWRLTALGRTVLAENRSLECPCCGCVGVRGMVVDGQTLECGCNGWVSIDPDVGPWINIGDDPCPPEANCHEAPTT